MRPLCAHEHIFSSLALSDIREVEDLIIQANYKGLIVGKMNQELRQLEVESCRSRDVKLEDLDVMLETLEVFGQNAKSMIGRLHEQNKTAAGNWNAYVNETISVKKRQEALEKSSPNVRLCFLGDEAAAALLTFGDRRGTLPIC